MGALALLASWALYRYTDLFAQLPLVRALDWSADKLAPLARQPWASGLSAVVLIAAGPALLCALVLGLLSFAAWPLSVAVLLVCMGPQRIVELDAGASDRALSAEFGEQYLRLSARDVVGCVLWAALLGAPAAVFYRAARELAESPGAAVQQHMPLIAQARRLFGALYWLPARLYAVALLACGSGGQLSQLSRFELDIETSDQLLLGAGGDRTELVSVGPKAVVLSVFAVAVVAFFI